MGPERRDDEVVDPAERPADEVVGGASATDSLREALTIPIKSVVVMDRRTAIASGVAGGLTLLGLGFFLGRESKSGPVIPPPESEIGPSPAELALLEAVKPGFEAIIARLEGELAVLEAIDFENSNQEQTEAALKKLTEAVGTFARESDEYREHVQTMFEDAQGSRAFIELEQAYRINRGQYIIHRNNQVHGKINSRLTKLYIGKYVEEVDDGNFEAKVLKGKGKKIIFVSADWCEACAKALERAGRFGRTYSGGENGDKIAIARLRVRDKDNDQLNSKAEKALTEKFGEYEGYPFFFFIEDGELVNAFYDQRYLDDFSVYLQSLEITEQLRRELEEGFKRRQLFTPPPVSGPSGVQTL